MKKKDPIEGMLEKMGDFLSLIAENSEKSLSKDAPEGIEKELDRLEKDVADFSAMYDTVLELAGATPKQQKEAPEGISPKEARLIEKAKLLRKEVAAHEKEYAKVADELKAKSGKKQSKKSKVQHRKKKFRRIGGKKDWKPL